MQDKLNNLKQQIIQLCSNPEFIHHKWFVKYHLEIVEKIAMELCDIYKNSDRDLVFAMAWFHDYGKIVNAEENKDYDQTCLLNLGFENEFVIKVIENIKLMDKSKEIDISNESIEVMIMSTADAASHMTGPFLSIYFYEHYNENICELCESNLKKLDKDWNRKMVLPEVKKNFEKNYQVLQELFGDFPEKFIN